MGELPDCIQGMFDAVREGAKNAGVPNPLEGMEGLGARDFDIELGARVSAEKAQKELQEIFDIEDANLKAGRSRGAGVTNAQKRLWVDAMRPILDERYAPWKSNDAMRNTGWPG